MYIGNTNTKRCHDPGCRAVKMIAPKHIQPTEDGEGFHVLCHWCGVEGSRKQRGTQKTLENYAKEKEMGIQECDDERYHELFEVNGCINCHSHNGRVLMHPHIGGEEVKDKPGKWWVYFECNRCHYETPYRKAITSIEKEVQRIKDEEQRAKEKTGA
jgi:hypothetical protein